MPAQGTTWGPGEGERVALGGCPPLCPSSFETWGGLAAPPDSVQARKPHCAPASLPLSPGLAPWRGRAGLSLGPGPGGSNQLRAARKAPRPPRRPLGVKGCLYLFFPIPQIFTE